MLVRRIWRNCDFLGKSVPVDAFWVEATQEEVEKTVFPLLTHVQQQESTMFAEQFRETVKKTNKSTRFYCFLVARDLSNITPLDVDFPFSHMWNSYSPFREISERKISSLGELKTIAKRLARKPQKCPVCGSSRIAFIMYGMPAFSPKLEQDLASGKIVLGGCCISDDDPTWQCADCETEFYRKP